jgi:hypothetical protein
MDRAIADSANGVRVAASGGRLRVEGLTLIGKKPL